MLKILNKVFTNQNGGDLLVDLFNQPYNFLSSSSTSLFTTILFFFSTQHKFSHQVVLVKTNFFGEFFQPINFYHHSPKEWVSVPMPPFLK